MSSKADKNALSERPIWLLCEGNDCYFFFIRVAEKLGLSNIYCMDVRGINDSSLFKDVTTKSNYNKAKTVIYARDAEYPKGDSLDQSGETYLESVKQSIKSRFESIGLSVGEKQHELTDNESKEAGYIILANKDGCSGTLEDLCLDIAVDTDAVTDAAITLDNVNDKRDGKVAKHKHKRRFHIAFALNSSEQMIGAKTGETVLYGGLDLNHERFRQIREFLEKVNREYR